MNGADDGYLSKARELHRRVVVIDTHCDTTQRLGDPEWNFSARHDTGNVDIPRLREGNVGAAFLQFGRPNPLNRGRESRPPASRSGA